MQCTNYSVYQEIGNTCFRLYRETFNRVKISVDVTSKNKQRRFKKNIWVNLFG